MTVQTLSPIYTDSNTPQDTATDRSRGSGRLLKRVVNNPSQVAHAVKRPAYTTTWDFPAARRLRTNPTTRPLADVSSLRSTRRLVNAGTRLVYPSRREVRNFMTRPIHAVRGRLSTFEEHQEDCNDGQSASEASDVISQPDNNQTNPTEGDQKVVLHVKVVRYDSNMLDNVTTVVPAPRGNRRDVGTQTDPVVLGTRGYVPCDTKYVQTDDTLETDTVSLPDMQIRGLDPNEEIDNSSGNDDGSAVTVIENLKIDASDIPVRSAIHNDAADEGTQPVQKCEKEPNIILRENINEQDNQSGDGVRPGDCSRTTVHHTALPQSNSAVIYIREGPDILCPINTTEASDRPQDAMQAPIGTNSYTTEILPEYWMCQPPPLEHPCAAFNTPNPVTSPSHTELVRDIQQLTRTFSQSLSDLVQQLSYQQLPQSLFQTSLGHQVPYQPTQLQQQPSQEPPQQPPQQSVYLQSQMQQQPSREQPRQPSQQPVLQLPRRYRYRPSQQPLLLPQQQLSQETPQPTQQTQYQPSQQSSSQPQQQQSVQSQLQPSQQLSQHSQFQPPLQPPSQPPPPPPPHQVPLGISMEPDLRLLNTAMSGLVRAMGTLRTLLRPHLASTPGPLRDINAAINAIEVALRAPLDGRTAGAMQRRRLVEEMFGYVDTATRLTTMMASNIMNPLRQTTSHEERPYESGRELNRLIRSVSRTLRRPRCVVEGTGSRRRGALPSSPPHDVRVFRPASPEPSSLVPPDDSIMAVISRLHSKTATAQLQRMLTELPRQQRILSIVRRLAADIRVPGEYDAIDTPIVLHIRLGSGGRFSCIPPDPPATTPPAIRPVLPVQPTQVVSDTVVPPSTNTTHWSTADGSLGPNLYRPQSTPTEVEPPPTDPPLCTCEVPPRNIDDNPTVEKWRNDLHAAVHRLQTSVNAYLGNDNSPGPQTWAETARELSRRRTRARGHPSDDDAIDGWPRMFADLSSVMESMDVDAHRNDCNDSLLAECMEAEQAIRDAASQTNTAPRYISLESECFSLPDGAIPTVYRTPSEFGASFDAYLGTLAENVIRYTTEDITAENTGHEPTPGASAAATYLNVNEFIAVLNNLRAHIQHVIQTHENQSTNMPTVVDQPRRIRYSSMANQPMRNNHPAMVSQPMMSTRPTMVNQTMRSTHPALVIQRSVINHPPIVRQPVMANYQTITNQPMMFNDQTMTNHSMTNQPTIVNNQQTSHNSNQNSYIMYELPGGNHVITNQPIMVNNQSMVTQPTLANEPVVNNNTIVTNKSTVSHPTMEINQTATERPMDLNPSIAMNHPTMSNHPTVVSQRGMTNYPPMVNQPVMINYQTMAHQPVMSNETMTSQSVATNQPTMTSHPAMTNYPIMATQPIMTSRTTVASQQGVYNVPTVANQPVMSNFTAMTNHPTLGIRPSTMVTIDHPTMSGQQPCYNSDHNSYIVYQLHSRLGATNHPTSVTNQCMMTNPTLVTEPVATNNSAETNKSTVSHPATEMNQPATVSQPMDPNPSIPMNQPGASNQPTVVRQPRTHQRSSHTAWYDRHPPPPFIYWPRYIHNMNGVPRLAYVAQPNPSYRGGPDYPIPQHVYPRDTPYPHPTAPQSSDSAEQERRRQETVRQFQQINELLRNFSDTL